MWYQETWSGEWWLVNLPKNRICFLHLKTNKNKTLFNISIIWSNEDSYIFNIFCILLKYICLTAIFLYFFILMHFICFQAGTGSITKLLISVFRIRFILIWIRILFQIWPKIGKISTFFFYKKCISPEYDLFCYLWSKYLCK